MGSKSSELIRAEPTGNARWFSSKAHHSEAHVSVCATNAHGWQPFCADICASGHNLPINAYRNAACSVKMSTQQH